MAHPVGIVAYERSLQAWVLDLPGCVAGGVDRAQLDEMLPVAIAEHLAWLRAHGERRDESTDWHIAERVQAGSHRQDFLFGADRDPMTDDELERLLRRAAYARADLTTAVRDVPPAVLDWVPPATAFASFDPWAPEPRSIRDVIEHVLQLQVFYRSSLRDGPAPGIFERVLAADEEQALTFAALRALSAADRTRVFRPLHPGSDRAGEWTVRKALRRIISHERAHAAEVAQRRAWVLLGPPHLRMS